MLGARATAATLLVAALTALAIGVSPAAATSEQAAATQAVSGRMLVAPGREALVTRLPARVVLRVPPRTGRLRVRLGRRDITDRFRHARGSLRVASLSRRNGLRYGPNHLLVRAERRGGQPVVQARSFILARRHAGMVRLRIRRGPVTSLDVRMAGPRLEAEHFGQRREFDRRLSAIRRQRTARVWLNGRRVTRTLDRSHPTRWTASLSATQGLRYGVNRLRMLVAEPEEGRYQLLRRRFVVRRDRHLAAAGWDTATRVGGRVRLDGRRSRMTHGGRPRHSWRIVSKPRGSHAKLHRARSARPLLTPDRRGRYVVGLTVGARTKRATASQAPPSSMDLVTLTVTPASLLLPFQGFVYRGGRPEDPPPAIKVEDTLYERPSDGAFQWLTLDRSTLKPCDAAQPCGPKNNITTGNSWFDPAASDEHGLKALTDALKAGGNDELVILAKPMGNRLDRPVNPDQVAAFNSALKLIGVGPIDKSTLTAGNQQLVIMGVPYGSDGSGWYSQVFNQPQSVFTGWLMPDTVPSAKTGATQFRFQPERPAFDTSSSKTATSNTMSIRDDRPTASFGEGVTGGFQVVELDPVKFTVVKSDGYGSNGAWDGLGPMVARLNEIRTQGTGYVAVQSIGHPTSSSPTWPQVTSALAAFGANPHTFSTVNGSYAFIGGTKLSRSEAIESSQAVAPEESGTLRGRSTIRADGFFKPAIADPAESHEFEMYDITFRAPTPWPNKPQTAPDAPDDADAAGYKNALAYISAHVDEFSGWAPDLRRAYVVNLDLHYSAAMTQLSNLKYPGDGQTCTQGPGNDSAPPRPTFSRTQFCDLHDELLLEFGWLDKTQTLFDKWQQALYRVSGNEQVDLQGIGNDIKEAIAPTGTEEALEILTDIGEFFLLVAEDVALFADSLTPLGVIEAAAAVYEIVTTVTSDVESHLPAGDEIKTKVDDLSRQVANQLSSTAKGLDSLQQVIVSDYGRLQALGSLAGTPGWTDNKNVMTDHLRSSARSFFYSELMPIHYGVYLLRRNAARGPDPTVDNCYDLKYFHTWKGAPDTAQLRWGAGFFDTDSKPVSPNSLWVLGRHSLSIAYYAYPPAKLTDPMFLPRDQSGLGMEPHRFVWEQYENVRNAPPTDIGYCTT